MVDSRHITTVDLIKKMPHHMRPTIIGLQGALILYHVSCHNFFMPEKLQLYFHHFRLLQTTQNQDVSNLM